MCKRQTESGPPDIPNTILSPSSIKLCLSIVLNTFSKTLAPSFRISYMVLPKHLVSVYRKQCEFLSCTVPKMDQYILKSFLEAGYFERHLNKMRALYKNRHDLLLTNLKPLLKQCKITGEHAGVHLLLHFNDERKEEDLISLAEENNIKVYGISSYDIENSKPGTVLLANDKKGLFVKAKDGIIKVLEIQGENAKRMNIKDYLRGNKINFCEMFE